VPELSPRIQFASGYTLANMWVGLDGSIYQSNITQNFLAGSIAVYDPVSLQLTSTIDFGRIDPTTVYEPYVGVIDNSGRNFFVSVASFQNEVLAVSLSKAMYQKRS
jgi:hypothetical protein